MATATVLKLYEFGGEYDALDELLAESEGELTPEIEALLADLDAQFDEKAERVALKIRGFLAEASAIKEEEARLAARRKARERSAESLKSYLQRQLELLGREKVAGKLVTVALQKNPPRVLGEPTEEQLRGWQALGLNLVRVVPERLEFDRKAALATLQSGECTIDGLYVEQSRSLRIR
jgi:hypothetical protein